MAEIPLLFESGMESEFDYVMLITAPETARRKRLAAKLTESQFTRRADRQIDEAEKAARADFVFDNSASRRRLKEFVGEVYARILAAAGAEGRRRRPDRRRSLTSQGPPQPVTAARERRCEHTFALLGCRTDQ